jgi:hypothetical protein
MVVKLAASMVAWPNAIRVRTELAAKAMRAKKVSPNVRAL